MKRMHKAYTLKYRRRRQGRTDYKLRLSLLISRKPRFVIRRKLNNIFVHAVEYDTNGDKTVASGHSRELLKYGWKGHKGNTPSAYLTGLLCGLRAKKKGIKEGILDIGLYRAVKGSSIFAAAKGIIDSKQEVKCNEKYFPSEERITGKNAKTDMTKNFYEVKNKILEKWQ